MKTYKIEVTKVIQPIGEFYIGKIDAGTLYNMTKADIMKITLDSDQPHATGIQRPLSVRKVQSIKEYLELHDCSFPNSIILNIDSKNISKIGENFIEVLQRHDTFKIIDGQHRLSGFSAETAKKFELIVSIFVDLDESKRRNLFRTINSEQTKVNSSRILYSYSEDEYYTPRKMVVKLAELFVSDKNSALYKKIKLLGTNDEYINDGIITLMPFSTPILKMIYDEKDFNKIRKVIHESGMDGLSKFDKKYKGKIFWTVYKEKNLAYIYKVFTNYFNSLEEVHKREWASKNSLLTKTTGYKAIMDLFIVLYRDGFNQGDLTYNFFLSKIKKTSNLIGKLNSKHYGASGAQASKELYQDLYDAIYD